MNRIAVGMLILALAQASSGFCDSGIEKELTPAQQFAALHKEYNPAAGAFRKAKSDRERRLAVERFAKLAARYLDLAEKYPKDPVALRALRQATQAIGSTDSAAQNAWEINRTEFPSGNNDGSAGRLVKILKRDHLRSDKLGPVIDRMRYGYRMEFAECLAQIEQSTPHRTIRAVATLALARNLKDRLQMLQMVEDRPALKKRYATIFGKDYLKQLQQASLSTRIEPLFERATKYDDVKHPYGGTIAEHAKSELYELRHLSIGKTAPEIVGQDQDGKQMKLSDYRGNVVLLYFWVEF